MSKRECLLLGESGSYMSINDEMNLIEILCVMGEENSGAINALMKMIMMDSKRLSYIFFCDSLDIRGKKLEKLYNICCNDDYKVFENTLKVLQSGLLSYCEIHTNLDFDEPIPFVDEEYVDGDWEEYCIRCKESYINRIHSKIEENNVMKLKKASL